MELRFVVELLSTVVHGFRDLGLVHVKEALNYRSC